MSAFYRRLLVVLSRNHPESQRLWWATVAGPCGPGCPHAKHGMPSKCSMCLGVVVERSLPSAKERALGLSTGAETLTTVRAFISLRNQIHEPGTNHDE